MIRLIRTRVLRQNDDEGSIMLVFLVLIIAVTLSTMAMGFTLQQAITARYAAKRVHTLHAAQAGLDAGIGQIRAATDASGRGVRTQLPCAAVNGSVARGATGSYTVTIKYWREDGVTQVPCVGGVATQVPYSATLEARGVDDATLAGSGNRTLQTTYVFNQTNANTAGGLIHIYDDGVPGHLDLCMDAGSDAPLTGTRVAMQLCAPGASKQRFAYDADLHIVLTSTISATSRGMCVATDNEGNGSDVLMRPCVDPATASDPDRARQQWSFNDNAGFTAAKPNGSLSDRCLLLAPSNVAGSYLSSHQTGCGAYAINRTFRPEPSVGAGAAGYANDRFQFVNYLQFGRCMDTTNWKVDWGFLIAYPCKQAPRPSDVGWNVKFHYDVTSKQMALWKDNDPATPYCLKSPMTTAASPPSYPTFQACPIGPTPANLQWTVNTRLATYFSSYTIVDGNGACLSLGAPSSAGPGYHPIDNNLLQWSTIIVEPCNGSLVQKWNAPPNLVASQTKDLSEK